MQVSRHAWMLCCAVQGYRLCVPHVASHPQLLPGLFTAHAGLGSVIAHLALGALQIVQTRGLWDARVPAEAVVPRLQRLQGAHTCGA